MAEYVSGCRPPERNENDHCLLACQVRVGGRRGCLLLDSGYHVPRTVCVMADRRPPHTGQTTGGQGLLPGNGPRFGYCSLLKYGTIPMWDNPADVWRRKLHVKEPSCLMWDIGGVASKGLISGVLTDVRPVSSRLAHPMVEQFRGIVFLC